MKKIAVWGLGRHAINNILPAISSCEELYLQGLFTRDESIRNEYSRLYNCISYSSHEEMLNDDSLSIVYLSTPPGLHYKQGIEILESGKHFWSEKPFVTSSDQAYRLIELSDKHDLTLAEGLMYRYHPQFEYIRDFVNGNLGEILFLNSFFTLPKIDSPGFRYKADLGGSSLLDIGIYPISLCMELMNFEKPQLLSAKLSFDDVSKVDTNGFVLLQFASGLTATLVWGMGYGYRNDLDILTKNGSLFTERIYSKNPEYEPQILLKDKVGNESKILSSQNNHFISMFNHFSSMLNNSKKEKEEKERILKLTDAIDEIRNLGLND